MTLFKKIASHLWLPASMSLSIQQSGLLLPSPGTITQDLSAADDVKSSGGRTFNGSNESFTVDDNATHSMEDVAFWFSVFFKPTDFAAVHFVLGKGTNDAWVNVEYLVTVAVTTGLVIFGVSDGNPGVILTSDTGLTAGQWAHLFGWHDPVTNKIWLQIDNGTPKSANFSAGVQNSTQAFKLGVDLTQGWYAKGSMAYAATGKPTTAVMTTLAATICGRLYNYGNGLPFSGITSAEKTAWGLTAGNGSYYDLNELSGNAIDSVAGVNLTDTNTVGVGNGPAESVAKDETANANHGKVLGKTAAAEITDWTAVTPDGSYTTNVNDGQGSNDGTMTGFTDVDAARTDDVSPNCAVSQSIRFDGTDDYVNCGASGLPSGSTARSWCAWIKVGTAVNYPSPFTYGNLANNRAFCVQITSSAKMQLAAYANNCNSASSTSMKLNKWYHFGITLAADGRSVAYFLNGVADGTGTMQATLDTVLTFAKLGYSWDRYFVGSIADVQMYSSVLTADNFLYIATNGVSGTAPASNPVSKWIGYDTPRTVADCADGLGLTLDGTDDYVSMGNVGDVTSVDVWLKCLAANQQLLTLNNLAAKAVTIVSNTLTFGAGLTGSAILIDTVSKNASQAGLLLNDGAWHRLQFTLTSVAADDFRVGTDGSDGTGFGNIVVDQLELNGGVLGEWKFDDGDQSDPGDGSPVVAWFSDDEFRWMQPTIPARPIIDLNGVGGKQSIEFDGLAKFMYNTDINKATQKGLVSISLMTGATVASSWILAFTDLTGATDYVALGINASSKLVVTHVNGGTTNSVRGGTTLAANTRYVVQFWSDGSDWGITLDGVAETLTVTGTNTGAWFGAVASPDRWSLGALYAGTTTGYFDGDIAYMVMHDDELTVGERLREYSYLKRIYGTGA